MGTLMEDAEKAYKEKESQREAWHLKTIREHREIALKKLKSVIGDRTCTLIEETETRFRVKVDDIELSIEMGSDGSYDWHIMAVRSCTVCGRKFVQDYPSITELSDLYEALTDPAEPVCPDCRMEIKRKKREQDTERNLEWLLRGVLEQLGVDV